MDFLTFGVLFGLSIFLVWVLEMICFNKIRKLHERERLHSLFSTLICEVKCTKCGTKMQRSWVKGDFMMKDVSFKHNATQVTDRKLDEKKELLTISFENKPCDGKTVINGIYVLHPPPDKDELKYRQLCEKWR